MAYLVWFEMAKEPIVDNGVWVKVDRVQFSEISLPPISPTGTSLCDMDQVKSFWTMLVR